MTGRHPGPAAPTPPEGRGPLDGVIVADLTQYVSGPYCTMLLADAGATVIKIEPPGGEHTRHGAPRVGDPDHGPSASFIRMNRGKRSVTLDLKTGPGRAAFDRILTRTDVLVENFRPGTLARLGWDPVHLHDVNPTLVYCTITGFGHTPSPWRDRAAFNLVAELEAGVYRQPGPSGTPEPLGPYVGDLFPGAHAVAGIAMALFQRERTGRGAHVDIAMFDSMLSMNELANTTDQFFPGSLTDYYAANFCPSGIYPARDGFVCLDVVTLPQWQAVCRVMEMPGLADRPELASGPDRAARFDDTIAAPFLAWLARHDADPAVTALTGAGVPAAVVRDPAGALASDQARVRGMAVTVSVSGQALTVPGNPIRFDDTPHPTYATAPEPGEHTLDILTGIAGLSPDDARRLTAAPRPGHTT